jgi:hypothetical protein
MNKKRMERIYIYIYNIYPLPCILIHVAMRDTIYKIFLLETWLLIIEDNHEKTSKMNKYFEILCSTFERYTSKFELRYGC